MYSYPKVNVRRELVHSSECCETGTLLNARWERIPQSECETGSYSQLQCKTRTYTRFYCETEIHSPTVQLGLKLIPHNQCETAAHILKSMQNGK
jgi:hypothetical protein